MNRLFLIMSFQWVPWSKLLMFLLNAKKMERVMAVWDKDAHKKSEHELNRRLFLYIRSRLSVSLDQRRHWPFQLLQLHLHLKQEESKYTCHCHQIEKAGRHYSAGGDQRRKTHRTTGKKLQDFESALPRQGQGKEAREEERGREQPIWLEITQ